MIAIPVAVLEVLRQVQGDVEPLARMQPRLVRADSREQPPDLVAELAAHLLGMRQAFAGRVACREETVERLAGLDAQLKPLEAARRVQGGDRQAGGPHRAYSPGGVRRRLRLGPHLPPGLVVRLRVRAS